MYYHVTMTTFCMRMLEKWGVSVNCERHLLPTVVDLQSQHSRICVCVFVFVRFLFVAKTIKVGHLYTFHTWYCCLCVCMIA